MKIVGARRLAAVMALGLATSLVAAPSLAASVTLKLVMASYTDGMQKYYEDLIAAFEKVNPDIKVELTVLASSEIGTKVRALIASGKSPDIVNSDEFSDEVAAGLLLQADQIVSAATLKDILPVFMKNSEFNGVAYALPDLASARAFFYNKKILAGAGLKKAPTTWTELEVAALAIKKKYPKVYPIGVPLGPEVAQEEFTIWGGGNGGRLYNRKTGKYTLNTPEYLTTLKFLKKLVDKKFIQPNPGKTNRTDGVWAIFDPENLGSWQACKERIAAYMGTSMLGNNQKKVLENMQLMCDMAMRDFKGHSHPGRDHSEHDH